MKTNKIFANYFEKNKHLLEQEMFEIETNNELDAYIANAVEDMLDDFPEDHPVRTQSGAEKVFALVQQSLNDPEVMGDIINSIVNDISDRLS